MAGSTSPVFFDQVVKNAKHKDKLTVQEAQQRELTIVNFKKKWMQWQHLRLNNEFGILNCPDGDTLAYIGPPPQIASENQTDDTTYIQNRFSYPLRVHSSKFLGLNSKKFSDLFGARSTFRTERRFYKEGILSHVPTKGIKFFIDLRPPMEDDEAVVLLTSLTCTKGVLTWHTAQDNYCLSPLLVAGQDDSSSIPLDFRLPLILPEDEEASNKAKLLKPKEPSNTEKESLEKEKLDVREAQYADSKTGLETDELDSGLQNAIASSLEIAAPESSSTNSKTCTKKPRAPTPEQSAKPSVVLPEYSSLRHRSAIERLVHAIEDGDPKLDSAPKVWTFFAIAKYFDCASHERISKWITNWLLRYPNSNFIQSNPEVALRIGLGTHSEIITKDAFSILVGEKSLMNVFGETCPSILSPLVQSVHGRKLELLDDDERNRIDHAAASLVRRIRQKFDELVGGEMAWLLQSSQYRKIFSLVPRNQEEADVVKNLAQKVKQFVRGRIIWVLCRTYDGSFCDLEGDLKKVRAFYPATPDTFAETYNELNENERIFTRFFWLALNQEMLADGRMNLWTEPLSRLGLPQAGGNLLCRKMLDRLLPSGERSCQIVSFKEVETLILQFNQIGRSHWGFSNPESISPVQNAHSETPVHQPDSAPSGDGAIDVESTKENTIPDLSRLLASQGEETQAQSGSPGFGYNNFGTQNYQPNPAHLSDRELLTQDISSRQPIADLSSKPSLSTHDDNPTRVTTSQDYPAIAKKGDQTREITRADYSFDGGNGSPGPVITAADWSWQADDVDWNPPKPEQYLCDYPNAGPISSQPQDLRSMGLLNDITHVLHRICNEIINPAHLFHDDNSLPTSLIDTLMCLNDEEWKYLPLWAGGNDDGTGGVFDEVDVPNLEAGGFRGGKRGIGSVSGSSASGSASESSFDDIGSDAISTIGKASRAATDGTQTVVSLSDIGSEDEGFMRQNELWSEIRNMQANEAQPVRHGNEEEDGADKGKGRAADFDDDLDDFCDDGNDGMDEHDADDVDTIVGAGSTGGDDDDAMAADEDPDFHVEGYDEDIEMVHADDL